MSAMQQQIEWVTAPGNQARELDTWNDLYSATFPRPEGSVNVTRGDS